MRGTQYLDAVLIMNMIDGRRPGAEYLERIGEGVSIGLQIHIGRYAGLALVYSGYCMYVRMLDNWVGLNMNM